MAINLSGLSTISSAVTALGGIAAVFPNEKGFYAQDSNDGTLDENALVFQIEDENTLSLNSDITDHAVEDNTFLNDQISVRPEIVTVRGFVGELSNVLPEALQIAREAKEKLIAISGYLPELTVETLRALNAAEQAFFTAQNASKIVKSLVDKDALNTTKQQEVMNRMYSYWREKTLFTIITPWGKFFDMAIQSCKVSQGGDTDTMSEFSVTFKKLRFATATFTSENEKYGRLIAQASPVQNNGIRAGEDTFLSVGEITA